MGIIKGEAVTVRRTSVEYDALGEPTGETAADTVIENVVVAPGATSDLDSTRPNGVRIAFTLCFPKGAGADLKDATVIVRGIACKVAGDPQRYASENTPGEWDTTVEVTRTDG